MPSSRVCLSAELFTFAPWLALPAALRAAVPALTALVAAHGSRGVLPWTPHEIRIALRLGPKSFAALLAWLERLQLGRLQSLPTGEAIGLRLTGMLHSSDHDTEEAPLPAAAEADRQRAAWREKKQRQRAQRKAAPVPPDVPASKGTCPPNVPPVSSHARALESTDSIRTEKDIDISFDSTSNDSKGTPAPTSPQPSQDLKLLPADVVQALVRHGISHQRAQTLNRLHGTERCTIVLAALPHWKIKNAAAAIESALANPEKWPIPPQVTQQSLDLMTLQRGGIAQRSTPTTQAEQPRREEKAARAATMDNEQMERLAWARLSQESRDQIIAILDRDEPVTGELQAQWDQARQSVINHHRATA